MPGNQNLPAGMSRNAIQQNTASTALTDPIREIEAAPAPGLKISRVAAGLRRFKWLIAFCVLLGSAGGVAATRFLVPEYEVQANVMLDQGGRAASQNGSGPFQASELFESSGYKELLTSYMVVDPIVTELTLYLKLQEPADSAAFTGFTVGTTLRPGAYALTVAGSSWVLSREPGVEVERGAVGDSIGRSLGFIWAPPASALAGNRDIRFTVQSPRESSNDLISRLRTGEPASLISLRFTDPNPQIAARILNAWVTQFVSVATALKKRYVSTSADILDGQRQFAADELTGAESALQRFRVNTVTEPSDRPTITPGIELTTNPAYAQYFTAKENADALQRDRQALQRILADSRATGSVSPEAVLSVPFVNTDPAADKVRKTIAEQLDKETQLRQLQTRYTDEFRDVKIARGALDTLRTAVVPRAIEAYVAQLTLREQRLLSDIERSGQMLQKIPVRTIEEERLKRKLEVADEMYRALDVEAAKAKLAEAQTLPDIAVLDTAVAPLAPTRNTAPVVILIGVAAGLGLGVLLALLLDLRDKRFRYPEQATDDLGLYVLGVIPEINARKRQAEEKTAQVIEAFRTIRMNVRYASDPNRPLALTITSPGPGDGKSLISANLALSFADAGARTLLIDGDVRRGELAKTFGIETRPGLVEYLEGSALIAEVMYPVKEHTNLTLIPVGARRKRAPELLATPRLSQLLAQLASDFDVLIVDSPPLGAGFDAFALGTATGNMAVVLRTGVSDCKMAAAKLKVAQTMPIRIIGAVLNCVKLTGSYEYYSYYEGYHAQDEEVQALPAPASKPGTAPVRVRNT